MTIEKLAAEARKIWPEPMRLPFIVIALGVVYGDICRIARDGGDPEELQKEFGNVIFSAIRWCEDQGFGAEECIYKAMECQRAFVAKRKDNG